MKVFVSHIMEFYKKQGRHDLPWRKTGISAYEVWVSEVMLQQTQVSRVINYYEKFIERFPDIHTLAKTSWDEFLPYYSGLGYYRRGENMLKTARIIVEKYEEKFPESKKELMSLPGIGEYTASAILSFAYNKNILAFDTNFQKVFGRCFYGNKKHSIDIKKYEKDIKVSKKIFNGAVMDFSNAICLKNPLCYICILSSKCKYSLNNGKDEVQSPRKSNTFPLKKAQIFLFLHKDHKEYYSSDKKKYKPFCLSYEWNTREKIKEYFRKKYKLELSVRPPYKKEFMNEVPTLFVNAQILQGRNSFKVFMKKHLEK